MRFSPIGSDRGGPRGRGAQKECDPNNRTVEKPSEKPNTERNGKRKRAKRRELSRGRSVGVGARVVHAVERQDIVVVDREDVAPRTSGQHGPHIGEDAETDFCVTDERRRVPAVVKRRCSALGGDGRGAFGKVFLARLKGHEQLYAIKALRKDVLLNEFWLVHLTRQHCPV